MPKLIINGKEIKDKETTVITRRDGTVEVIIEKKPEDKAKKEEELKAWKNTMKKELLFTIGKLFKEIALNAQEIDVRKFVAENKYFPQVILDTYGITVNREEQEALMFNSLFDGFKKIDNLKGKDIPKVEAILKQVRGNIEAFKEKKKKSEVTYHFGTPPKEI